jgi:hypothetical protein
MNIKLVVDNSGSTHLNGQIVGQVFSPRGQNCRDAWCSSEVEQAIKDLHLDQHGFDEVMDILHSEAHHAPLVPNDY